VTRKTNTSFGSITDSRNRRHMMSDCNWYWL